MDTLILTLLGLASGVATSWILQSVRFGDFSIWPGVLFGIAIIVFYVLRRNQHAGFKLVGFVLLSIVSYYAAFQVTDALAIFLNGYPAWIWYFIGGTVGGFILSLCFSWLLHHLKRKEIATITFLGGILGAVGYSIAAIACPDCYLINMGGGGVGFNSLYIIWQTGMALGLAMVS